jgi:hypothetical protein
MLAVHQFQVPILPEKILCKLLRVQPQFSEDCSTRLADQHAQRSITVLLLCGGWQGYMSTPAHAAIEQRTNKGDTDCMGRRKKAEDDDPIPSPVRQISSSPVGISIDLLPTMRDRRRCLCGSPVRPPHSLIQIASFSSPDAGACTLHIGECMVGEAIPETGCLHPRPSDPLAVSTCPSARRAT